MDVKRNYTIGVEKFLTFMKYYKFANQLEVNPILQKELNKYKKIENSATNNEAKFVKK